MAYKSPQEEYEALPEWARKMVDAMKVGGYSIGVGSGGFAEYALPLKARKTGMAITVALDQDSVHLFFDGLRTAYDLARSLRGDTEA